MVTPIRVMLAAALILATSLSSGCLETLDGDLLTPTAERSTALVDQMLAGDIADAFAQFRGSLATDLDETSTAVLTDEQRAAIEGLQAQLDAGTLAQDEFVAQVLDVIGDTQPDSAFAGSNLLGTPFEGNALSVAAGALGLTSSQQRQALAIYRALHGDIGKAREIVKDEILAMLTTQQAALLEQLATQLFDQLDIPEAQRPAAKLVFDTLAARLNLSLLQTDQIGTLRTTLREVVGDLHGSARDQFLTLLTDEQRQLLSGLENSQPSTSTGEDDTVVSIISDLIPD